MSRLYRGEGIVVDLDAVSCVFESSAVIGGVNVKLSTRQAAELSRYFVASRSYGGVAELEQERRDKKLTAQAELILDRLLRNRPMGEKANA